MINIYIYYAISFIETQKNIVAINNQKEQIRQQSALTHLIEAISWRGWFWRCWRYGRWRRWWRITLLRRRVWWWIWYWFTLIYRKGIRWYRHWFRGGRNSLIRGRIRIIIIIRANLRTITTNPKEEKKNGTRGEC